MRNKLLILLSVLLISNAYAQSEEKSSENSDFRAGFMWYYTGLKPAQEGKARKYDRLIFDIVYNDWAGDNGPFENHWGSIGLNTSMMWDIPFTGNNTSFGIGISHQLMRIRHDNAFFKYSNPDKTEYNEAAITLYDKNILAGNMFAMPVEFRFRKKEWRHFKFHIGGKIGFQANMYSKQVFGSGQNRDVVKDYGFPDLNRLVYGAHMRIGIRNWALYASYNFNPIFSNSESTKLYQLQFGLSISLY